MLLTAEPEERKNSLADHGGLEEGGMGDGPQSLHNENGQSAMTEGVSLQINSLSLQSPPAPSLYCSNHFVNLSSNLFL